MRKLSICLVAVLALALFCSCATKELQQLDYTCEGLYMDEAKRFQIAEIPFGEDYKTAVSKSVSYELHPDSPEPDASDSNSSEVYAVKNPVTFMGKPVTMQFTVSAETGIPRVVVMLYQDDDADALLEFYNQIVDEMLELYGLPRLAPIGGVEQRDGSTMQWVAWENYGVAPSDADAGMSLDEVGNQTNAAVRIMEYQDAGDCVVVMISD